MKNYIVDFAKNKIKELGLKETNIIINHRIGSLGRCTNVFVKKEGQVMWNRCEKIQFHRSVLTLPKEQQEQIALHEIAHYIQAKEEGRSALLEEDYGHGKTFKKICKRIGCELNSSTTTYWCGKYYLICDKCGEIVGSANRMSKSLLEDIKLCTSKCCDATVSLRKNY